MFLQFSMQPMGKEKFNGGDKTTLIIEGWAKQLFLVHKFSHGHGRILFLFCLLLIFNKSF